MFSPPNVHKMSSLCSPKQTSAIKRGEKCPRQAALLCRLAGASGICHALTCRRRTLPVALIASHSAATPAARHTSPMRGWRACQ